MFYFQMSHYADVCKSFAVHILPFAAEHLKLKCQFLSCEGLQPTCFLTFHNYHEITATFIHGSVDLTYSLSLGQIVTNGKIFGKSAMLSHIASK